MFVVGFTCEEGDWRGGVDGAIYVAVVGALEGACLWCDDLAA